MAVVLCCRRYQPEEEGEEGDAEDQPWHFVFHSPTNCCRHRLPSAAQDWLQSRAAAAAAAAEAPAAAAAAAEGAEVAQALVAVQQAGAAAEAQQAAEQQGVLAEPPLPPLPAEQVHKPKRRRRATTTVGGQQQAAAEHCSDAGPPSSLDDGAPRMPPGRRSQRKPASGLPAAAAEGPPAIGGGEGPIAGSRAASEHQLTQAEVAAALQQAGALQGAEPSQPLVQAQPSPAAPAPTAQAPLATPAAELRTPQAQPQVPATQQQEGQAQQQQEQQQPQGHMAQQPPQPPKLPQQPPVQAQASAEPPQWQPADAAGWGQLMDRLARVVQGCVAAGLVDQGTAWKVRKLRCRLTQPVPLGPCAECQLDEHPASPLLHPDCSAPAPPCAAVPLEGQPPGGLHRGAAGG